MTVKMEDRVPVARFFSLVWEKRKLQILEFFPHGVGQGGLLYKAIMCYTFIAQLNAVPIGDHAFSKKRRSVFLP